MNQQAESTTSPVESRGGLKLRGRDCLLLVVICILLYGWAAISGRPLSMHEARLPELAREMVQGKSNWILPQSGGRPWLERPPLPMWFIAAADELLGRTDRAWIVRLPGAVMGCLVVLMTAWMAGRWFGRDVGLISGLVLATTYEFYQYATLAEDDIYLAAIVCLAIVLFVQREWFILQPRPAVAPAPDAADEEFDPWSVLSDDAMEVQPVEPKLIRREIDQRQRRRDRFVIWRGLLTWRRWPVVGFFVALGLSNWAKGPLVGAIPVVATLGVFLLWNHDRRWIGRYVWLWGWIALVALSVAWPYLAYRKYPDVWGNWVYDYTGRIDGGVRDTQFDKPFWYYLVMLPGYALLPWTAAMVYGLVLIVRRAWARRYSAERFVLCWALVPTIVLSLAARKHHHYLVPLIAPWAILGAIGLVRFSRFLFAGKGPDWSRRPGFGLLVLGIPGAMALILLRKWIPAPPRMVGALAVVWIACVWMFYQGLHARSGRLVLGSVMLGLIVGFGFVQGAVAGRDENTVYDIAFLHQVNALVPPEQPLMINAAVGTLDFFREQFYLRDDARLLHNLTFLRDRRITSPGVFVVTRARDAQKLTQFGRVYLVVQSQRTRRETSPGERFTLYYLRFDPKLERCDCPAYIGVMEAMQRKPGPYCGGPL